MMLTRVLRAPTVLGALVLFAVFLVLHLLGGRQYVGILSGTIATDRMGFFFGVAYALSWFAAVLLAPILLLAGVAEASLHGRRSVKRS
ncbi:hypothetical protein MYSTI_00782 [Myxococcus stipitatus DSM 14675]|uniref:Uncharacterized protein n=1 Tax=Myxococcus stipitatus (strain DSM 14675 / JCM 12634 / Mx s8) TaxID=1278073 RepID=L7U022_MYXSD|nr:hypothetical protein [Myxococcus stipitatus]AGC42131.1 hypothetical protein MYSTI_00782 [Myxococcus stipitatus DSM 14675]